MIHNFRGNVSSVLQVQQHHKHIQNFNHTLVCYPSGVKYLHIIKTLHDTKRTRKQKVRKK